VREKFQKTREKLQVLNRAQGRKKHPATVPYLKLETPLL
jgi:hypothetical protein